MLNIYKPLCLLTLFLLLGLAVPLSAQNAIRLGTSAEVAASFKIRTEANGLKASRPGRLIRQLLPGQDSLLLRLQVSKTEGHADVFIGEVANKKNSTFFLKVNGRQLSGYIILKDQKKAYKYTSTAAGLVSLQQVDIDKVLCIEYQRGSAAGSTAPQQVTSAEAAIDITTLQSLPGAAAVVLLDFDGQYVKGSYWNNGDPIDAAPATLSSAEILETWKMISEDYAPVSVNITTSEAVYQRAPVNRRVRVIFTPTNFFYPNAGGVSYVGAFTWGDDTPSWVFNSGAKFAGEAGSHEIGHALGLSHDGRTSPAEAYYYGQDSWAPIMGAGYNRSMVQWSKGEYLYANNTEDDLSIITTQNGFGYKPDDHGNTASSATPLQVDGAGNVSATTNTGLITTSSDVDVFSFSTGGGPVALTVASGSTYANLDVLLTLKDASGKTLVISDPAALSASISQSLKAGTYYLYVKGAKGALGADSNYGSLGGYTISGSISTANASTVSVARITSGGSQYTDSQSHTWSADAYFSGGLTSAKSFDVAGTTDDALYLKYRYASAGAPFSYSIPVSAGTYRVKLYFLEPYFGAPGGKTSSLTGARVFHVDVEGQRVLSNYDIYTQDGAGKAVVKTFENVAVSDGNLTIAFTSVKDNAIISAIELQKVPDVVQYTLSVGTTGSGTVKKSPDQPSYDSGTSVSLTATPAQGYVFTGWSSNASGTMNPLVVVMNTNKTVTANFEPASVARITSGGSQYTDSQSHTWSADAYFSGGLTSAKSFDVAGTTDDALYLKYRYASAGAPFSYSIPVSAGTYRVKLYFLEPYFGAPGGKTSSLTGARVFHVDVEGQRVLSNYDIYTQDGAGKAVVKTFENVAVSDGNLTIAFTSVKDNAIISAIEVERVSASAAIAAITPAEALDNQAAFMGKSIAVYPNPFSDRVHVSFTVTQAQPVAIEIFDTQGRAVATLYKGQAAAGQAYDFDWSPDAGLAAGMYLLRLHTADKTSSQKIILNR
ncbi:malectin domain-containing carbohydrate-binding protein [Pontibacter chitinilyticus]|uniref:malectin domain-containing carbohydrate-binding protein n=1 Tax=Pontibacter chitinilyticus TaxID=2674989 RepID=UPI00321ADDF3